MTGSSQNTSPHPTTRCLAIIAPRLSRKCSHSTTFHPQSSPPPTHPPTRPQGMPHSVCPIQPPVQPNPAQPSIDKGNCYSLPADQPSNPDQALLLPSRQAAAGCSEPGTPPGQLPLLAAADDFKAMLMTSALIIFSVRPCYSPLPPSPNSPACQSPAQVYHLCPCILCCCC